MSNLLEHAKRELDLLGMPDASEYDEITGKWNPDAAMRIGLLDIVFNFSEQGHSGFSAGYALSCLEKLLRFENLTPLTNNPAEWQDVAEFYGEPMWQNRRNSHCFSFDAGISYYHLEERREWVGKFLRHSPNWFSKWAHKNHINWIYPFHISEQANYDTKRMVSNSNG